MISFPSSELDWRQRDCFTKPRHIRETEYYIGLDLGQTHDPTAISILERRDEVLDRNPVTYNWNTRIHRGIRHLHRVPLNTPYPDIVDMVYDLLCRPEIQPFRRTLIVDGTGVGKPVVDMFRKAKLPCRIMPVTITAGERQTSDGSYWRIPKRDLITGLLLLFQSDNINISSRLPEAKVLVKELANMRVKVTLSGNEQYGVWREGLHDDLVLATALAAWREGAT